MRQLSTFGTPVLTDAPRSPARGVGEAWTDAPEYPASWIGSSGHTIGQAAAHAHLIARVQSQQLGWRMAVLPFRSVGTPISDGIALGMAEEVSAALSRFRAPRLIATGSASVRACRTACGRRRSGRPSLNTGSRLWSSRHRRLRSLAPFERQRRRERKRQQQPGEIGDERGLSGSHV